jgi:hypothetical protein
MNDSKKESRLSIIWPAIVIIMAIAVILMVYQNYQLRKEIMQLRSRPYSTTQIPSLEEGNIAQPFMGFLPDGHEFHFQPDSLDKPVVIAWFSYDCEPCLDALKRWNYLAQEYPDQIIGVETENWHDGALFSSNEAVFQVLSPASPSVKENYQVYSTPQTIVVLPSGKIGYVKHGVPYDNSIAEIESILAGSQ